MGAGASVPGCVAELPNTAEKNRQTRIAMKAATATNRHGSSRGPIVWVFAAPLPLYSRKKSLPRNITRSFQT